MRTSAEGVSEKTTLNPEFESFLKVWISKAFYKGDQRLSMFYSNFLDEDGNFSSRKFDDFVKRIIGIIGGVSVINRISIEDMEKIITGKIEDFNDGTTFSQEVFGLIYSGYVFNPEIKDSLTGLKIIKKHDDESESNVKKGILDYYRTLEISEFFTKQISEQVLGIIMGISEIKNN